MIITFANKSPFFHINNNSIHSVSSIQSGVEEADGCVLTFSADSHVATNTIDTLDNVKPTYGLHMAVTCEETSITYLHEVRTNSGGQNRDFKSAKVTSEGKQMELQHRRKPTYQLNDIDDIATELFASSQALRAKQKSFDALLTSAISTAANTQDDKEREAIVRSILGTLATTDTKVSIESFLKSLV